MSTKNGPVNSPKFLGWSDHFSKLPITREQVMDFVTQLKSTKVTNDDMDHMAKYIFTALVQNILKCQPPPKFQDSKDDLSLFTVDEELVDHFFGGPTTMTPSISIFGKISILWSSKILQVFLVTSGSAAILVKNKLRYVDSIEKEEDKKLFKYFVDLVDPAHSPAAAGDKEEDDDEWPKFPFEDCECPAGLETYKFMDILDEGVSQFCPLAVHPPSRPILLSRNRVLTIDGGGIRGLVPLQALKELEAGLEPGQSIQSCFDLIVGTSTGGLIALTLAMGHKVQEIEALYFQMKDKIFGTGKPYDGANFEEILQNFFGPDKKMRDIKGVKVVVTSTFGTVEELRLKLFTNFDQLESGMGEEKIWKVARRTSAAPSYFDPMTEEEEDVKCGAHGHHTPVYYDGGLMANNPTRAILIRYTDLVRDGIVVSLGTGKPVGENTPLPALSNVLSMWWFGDLRKFADAFINRITRTDGDVVEDDLRLCKEFNCAYFRLTPSLLEVIELDETDEGKIVNLMWLTKAFIHRQRDGVKLIMQHIMPAIIQNDEGNGWGCPIQ